MYKRVLFIVKKGSGYSSPYSYAYNSSGLLNSAHFVVRMLVDHGIEAKLVTVNDNNDIDREVHKFKPDVVVIEALWVVPEKFEVLHRLYPDVQWVVRVHSDIPFLAQEGIAIKWIRQYVRYKNVYVAFNKHKTFETFSHLVRQEKLLYLPNYFPAEEHTTQPAWPSLFCGKLNVGCFGAIRPLKNQLIQAVAAIRYADEHEVPLHFHINSTRIEGGEEVLKNLRALFQHTKHKLIEHIWHSHRVFQYMLERMDVAMCVSFSETFCIVAADAVALGVPLVCSSEVPWANRGSVVQPTSVEDIAEGINRVLTWKSYFKFMNKLGLKEYGTKSVKVWKEFLES